MHVERWNRERDWPLRSFVPYGFFDEPLFRNVLNEFGLPQGRQPVAALDVKDTENSFYVQAEIPGVKKDDISVHVDNNILTISAEKRREQVTEDESYVQRECRYGKVERSIPLPRGVGAENVVAQYENGVLCLELPKTHESESRRKISVQ